MKPIKILLVEDNLADVGLTEEALIDTGIRHKLTVARDGDEAMSYLKQHDSDGTATRPELVLLDLNMPKKNGHEVLREIKEDPDLNDIPVILLTVSTDQDEILSALRIKMNYYLNKPVDPKTLRPLLMAIDDLWC